MMAGMSTAITGNVEHPHSGEHLARSPNVNSETPPDYMLRTLDYVDSRYGGVELYLRTIGLRETKMFNLRSALVRSHKLSLVPSR